MTNKDLGIFNCSDSLLLAESQGVDSIEMADWTLDADIITGSDNAGVKIKGLSKIITVVLICLLGLISISDLGSASIKIGHVLRTMNYFSIL